MLKTGLLTLDDYVWGVEVAATRMILEEVKRPELLNKERLYFLVDKMIEDGTAIIAKDGNKPVGVIASLLVPNTFNPELKTLAEVIWYVLPEYRNTRAGALLLKAHSERAAEVADETTLSLLPTSLVKFDSLEKRGYHLEEFNFRKVM